MRGRCVQLRSDCQDQACGEDLFSRGAFRDKSFGGDEFGRCAFKDKSRGEDAFSIRRCFQG